MVGGVHRLERRSAGTAETGWAVRGHIAEQAARVEGLEAMREQERQRQHQARLAELGALAATVAHDVRNPLNVIGMAAALAPPDVRAEISDGVARIARLADDLLDFAKPWSVRPESVDLLRAAQVWQRRYPRLSLGAGLRAGLLVQADPRRLQQAVHELARRFTAPSPAQKSMPIAPAGPSRSMCATTAPASPTISDPACSNLSSPAGLAGPGSAWRSRQDHGGPWRGRGADRAAGLDHLLHSDPACGAMTGGGHILLADDEPAFQRLGGAWLRNAGHRVSLAGDGEQAIQVFARERPDVVLLDLSMPPAMDPAAGLELIRAFAPAPVIVLTGHAEHELALTGGRMWRVGFPGQASRSRHAADRGRASPAESAARGRAGRAAATGERG